MEPMEEVIGEIWYETEGPPVRVKGDQG
jgi:hypothetical protein